MSKKYPKGIAKVAKRVMKAAKDLEKVIIFGDADLDGIASVVILKELLEFLNPLYSKEKIRVYFPDRDKEGYGLNQKALDYFKKHSPALLFLVDTGISSLKEIRIAKKLGFEVIVIDHHQVLGRLPKADLIVNPKQKADSYPFKDLAAAGLVYKLAEYILAKKEHSKVIKDKFLELTALATLADLMPLDQDNKGLVDKGLEALSRTQRPAILALIQLNDIDINSELDITQKIIAPLNSSRIKDHISESYVFLSQDSFEKAKVLAQKLLRQTEQKKQAINLFVAQLTEEIRNKDKDKAVIFKYSSAWPAFYNGTIASKILKIFKKPVFMCSQGANKEYICSARLPKEFDGVKAMASCKKFLETYGGHAPACGCRLKKKNLKKFGLCLEEYFR